MRGSWVIVPVALLALSLSACGGGSSSTQQQAPPVVTAVNPPTGGIGGGTKITVQGTGFVNYDLGVTDVQIGGESATQVVVQSDTTITCTTPPHAAGAVEVSVTKNAGSGSLASGFTYNPPPTLASLTPTEGSRDGGLLVTLTGTGFLNNNPIQNVATFGGIPGTGLQVVDDTTLTCITPKVYFEQPVDVIVTNHNGAAGLADAFTYRGPIPQVYSVSPNAGGANGGTLVTVTGDYFTIPGGVLRVTFGGQQASSVTRIDDQHLTCVTSPSGTLGLVAVAVSNTNGQSTLPDAFTFFPPPVLSSISPNQGLENVETPVTLTGSGFQDVGAGTPTILFGSIEATNVVVVNDTQVTCNAPSQSEGTVDVALTNTHGTVTLLAAFTYHWKPTYDTSFGTLLSSFYDDDSSLVSFGFDFPFYGTNWSQGYLDANGYIDFGGIHTSYSGTFSTYPCIMLVGWDLMPYYTGAYYKVTANPPRFTFTFSNCYWYYLGGAVTAQLQIKPSGEFAMFWISSTWYSSLAVGVSPGSPYSQVGVNWSSEPSWSSGQAAWQQWSSGTNLFGNSMVFRPNGNGGYSTELLGPP